MSFAKVGHGAYDKDQTILSICEFDFDDNRIEDEFHYLKKKIDAKKK